MTGGYHVKSTQATASLFQSDATVWTFDFSKYLLFDEIAFISYSIQVNEDVFVRHKARKPKGLVVEVVTDVPVNGTVYISVDQSRPAHKVKTTPVGHLPRTSSRMTQP